MSTEHTFPNSLEAFYAQALGLEYECEHRLIDLGRTLEAHHNPEAAAIFEQAEKMRAANILEISRRCEKLNLPRIAPWDYYWHQHLNFENICIDSVHYLITAFEAIELVLAKLEAAGNYYQLIRGNSDQRAVREAALEIIGLLNVEMDIVQGWRSQHIASTVLPDLDPPNQPE